MSKITLNSVADLTQSSTAQTTINTNSSTIQTAFDNTLSRDGTSPNQMGAAIDMNSNQIFNLPTPSTQNSPARLIDVVSNPTITVPGTGTSGHVVPFLDTANTWSAAQTFPAAQTYAGVSASLSNAVTIYNAFAGNAGGTSGVGYKMSSIANFGIFFGSGVPTLSAAQGSLYLRTDGSSTSTRMYINTNGSTTWTAVTTVA